MPMETACSTISVRQVGPLPLPVQRRSESFSAMVITSALPSMAFPTAFPRPHGAVALPG